MYVPSSIQPGVWANITTNMQIRSADGKEQDIVESPVFVMSREERGKSPVVMLVDQKLNQHTWYDLDGSDYSCPQGVLCGFVNNRMFQAKVRSFQPIQNVDLTNERIKNVMQTALEIRAKFLDKNPDMKNDFFQVEQKKEVNFQGEFQVELPICSITQEPFRDPVTAPDGRNYERVAIVAWLEKHGTSPFTKQPMRVDQLITNFDLRPAADRK